MSEEIISAKTFLGQDQDLFAKFSGDINPIHVDVELARRSISGQCILHGIHGLLWALESFLKINELFVSSVCVRFLKPVFLNEEVVCYWKDQTNQLILKSNDTAMVVINFTLCKQIDSSDVKLKIWSQRQSPERPSFFDCTKFSNKPFKVHGSECLAPQLFPFLCQRYGIATVLEMGAISQLVGMECPGLHSLFTDLKLTFKDNNLSPNFTVFKSDERVEILNISVVGRCFDAVVRAFYRPLYFTMPTILDLSSQIQANEFSEVSALIIGGSRGLGEVVAKSIAAGGGKVIITYTIGKKDALRVRDEIRNWGADCEIIHFTVNEQATPIEKLPNFNQLYYFATPKIFGKRSTEFDEGLVEKFSEIYLRGFKNICEMIVQKKQSTSVLYPSTIAIDEPIEELAEYIDVKIEGERVCRELNNNQYLKIFVPRLPRIDTDQTQSVLKVKSESSLDILIPLVRELSENISKVAS